MIKILNELFLRDSVSIICEGNSTKFQKTLNSVKLGYFHFEKHEQIHEEMFQSQ
jgi:hypothetical protein